MRLEDRRHHKKRQPDREAAGQLQLLHVAISQAYAPSDPRRDAPLRW
jgi:hypothetical protein